MFIVYADIMAQDTAPMGAYNTKAEAVALYCALALKGGRPCIREI